MPPPVSVAGKRSGAWSRVREEFALGPLTTEYRIPREANNFWYSIGGVLMIMLGLEVISGFILAYEYVPDAATAFATTQGFFASPFWAFVVKFHFWNSWMIFFLILAHMFRVIVTGGYLEGKKGLWLTGVALAVFAFFAALTGEALHWDEIGFGVPWNVHEVLAAVGLDGRLGYTTDDLLNVTTASAKLAQIYAAHIALVPLMVGALIAGHFYLIREKGISAPFWKRASGERVVFTSHMKRWLAYSAAGVALLAMAVYALPHDAGVAPQLVPSSPYYGQDVEPGGLVKPTFPISWTAGMNAFVAQFGVDPDIWGTLLGMLAMLLVLVAVPWLDRSRVAPHSTREAFDLRKRWGPYAALLVVLAILVIGAVESIIMPLG